MKPFVLVATLVALANARPEAGYSYPRPSLIGGHNTNSFTSSGTSFGTNSFTNHGTSSSFNHGTSSSFNHGLTSFDGGFTNNHHHHQASHSDHGLHTSHAGGVTVQKHIYVHVPPPEPEEIHHHRPIHVPQAQKHYKIIFIKAPTAATPTAPTIPLQAQNEEKTLVYVLVKKPDEAPEISIPTVAPTQPSKPEVYFIRYKTQKETTSSGTGVHHLQSGSVSSSSTTGLDLHQQQHHHGADISSSVISGADSGVHSHHHSGTSGVSSSYGPPGQSGPY